MKLYKLVEYQTSSGRYNVQCADLVATGRNWSEPAKVLNISIVDFLKLLRNEYGANIEPYRKNGKIVFIGYNWDSLPKARKFINMINRKAKDRNYLI